MSKFQCYSISDPNAQWNYCPSYAAAITFCVLFGLTLTTHAFQAYHHRRRFAIVITMAAAWEFAGYILRILSVEWQTEANFATAQQLLILLAPLWINAFVYMVLGRMIHFYLPDDSVYNVKARRITTVFVWCDIVSFIIQAAGGSMTGNGNSMNIINIGLHVYMGGVGLQLVFIGIFMSLAIRFQQKIRLLERSGQRSQPAHELTEPYHARHLLYVVYAVLGLIVFRNIYRLIEFSSGVESKITQHEWYTWVFDGVPMFLALVLFNVCHPCRVLIGPNSDFSVQNREAKEGKKAAKHAKKMAKAEKKEEKKVVKAETKEERKLRKYERLETRAEEMV